MSSGSQYFEGSPNAPSRPKAIELTLPDVYLSLETDRGVFSADRVDPGSAILLRHHPPIPTSARSILDLGCGYGTIALTAAKRAPNAQIVGVDVNARAIDLARRNGETNECANASFLLANDLASEGSPISSDSTFDLILSNPPIRIGKTALHELLTQWLDRLSPTGRAWMVVQKHLGADSLATWLTSQGWETTRLTSQRAFRVLEVLPR